MTDSTLVVMAAGSGTRFGGLKQLAPVRDDGSTVTDLLLARAAAAGIDCAVIVVQPAIEDRVRAHLATMDPSSIPVEIAVQVRPRGTADAVLAARDAVRGAIVVVNADDLYPASAFALIAAHLRDGPADEHAVVGFRLDRTLIGSRPEMRALLTMDAAGALVDAREVRIEKDGGLHVEIEGAVEILRGDEPVSMNMWGLWPSVFVALAAAVDVHDPDAEVFLPHVVANMIAEGAVVRVLQSDDTCIGITYPEDVDAVRAAQS